MKLRKNIRLIIFLSLFMTAGQVGAVMLSVDCITQNDLSGQACNVAESQLQIDMQAIETDQVLFTFSNTGSGNSFIANIYFMLDGVDFLELDSILNPESGVLFSEGSHPAHLPGYHGRADFSAGAVPGGRHSRGGRKHNGINAGESLDILFSLDGGTFDDLYDAVISGDFVIGLHVQGLGEGGEYSESLVSFPPLVVPLPASVWLLGSGVLGMLGIAKRRR